ncbi:MAG: hypothetical protein GY849_22780 [Deltaproteobacteria bacterium]|nr:hypothetical protein [Deltaproteobacteria bacterium]
MKIAYQSCNTSYDIPRDRIPRGKKVSAKCKKCGSRIVIQEGPTRKATVGK